MGSGDGDRVVGSSDGPCVKTVGRKVGELVGQAEPRSWLPVVIFQPNVTLLERACTCVGKSEQSWLLRISKYDVILVSLPSSVGMAPVS